MPPLRPRHSFRSPTSSTACAARRPGVERLAERGDQAIGLQSPLAGVEAEMGGQYAQHPIADHQLGIERRARLVIRYREVDRAGRGDRKAGQDCVGETSAMTAGAGAENDLAAGRLGEIGRLVVVEAGWRGASDLLQTGNVGIDLVQHGRDPRRVVTAVDPDAAMNVVSGHFDRGLSGGRDGENAGRPAVIWHQSPLGP